MTTKSNVLLIEDDPAHAELAARAIEHYVGAYKVEENLENALSTLRKQSFDLILSDLRLPDGSALDLLSLGYPTVVMTSQGDEARAVAAMKAGALDYLVKSPEMYRDLPITIERALRTARSERERVRTEQSLRESEARFQQLAQSIEDAFWLYDLHSQSLIYSSPAFNRVYGQELLTNHLFFESRGFQIYPEDRHRLVMARETVLSGAPTESEYRLNVEQSTRWVFERMFPIFDSNGAPYRIAGLGADITKRRELEETLRQAQKMEAIGQLAGGIAHDFNNMLSAILGAAGMLVRVSQDPSQKKLSTLIVSASERAAELTRKLLTFSRKGRVQSSPIDLNELVRETVALLERSIDRKVQIDTQLHPNPLVVLGDASELQHALLNMGINSRDAMPTGGELRFITTTRNLEPKDCASLPFELAPGEYSQISVIDSGCGIPQEIVGRIFEPFFTLKPIGEGTGLGLAAVYGTVVAHRGAITVESSVGQGTTFHIFLPLSEKKITRLASQAPAPEGSGVVLVIDDEPMLLDVGAALLQSLGYRVLCASNGQEAIRVFSEHQYELGAVLCDVVMPKMSGPEVAIQLKKINPRIPVILCSGYPEDHKTTPGVKVDAFLSKPYVRSDLARVLSSTVHQK